MKSITDWRDLATQRIQQVDRAGASEAEARAFVMLAMKSSTEWRDLATPEVTTSRWSKRMGGRGAHLHHASNEVEHRLARPNNSRRFEEIEQAQGRQRRAPSHKHDPKPYTHLASFNKATSARYPRGPGKVPMLLAATKLSPGLIRPDASIGPGTKSKPVTTMPWVVVAVLLLALPLGSLFGKMVVGGLCEQQAEAHASEEKIRRGDRRTNFKNSEVAQQQRERWSFRA